MIAPIRAPRPPHGLSIVKGPRAPSGAPKAPRLADPVPITELVRAYPPAPPQWVGSELEWIVWWALVERGWKIFGRQNVRGRTDIYADADAIYQPAIPVAGLNIVKDFFRADFLLVPGKKAPSPGPPFPRGVILDPVTPWTHPNAGIDRLRRSLLARAGYLLVWLDGAQLQARPKEVIAAAISGADDSSIDRGGR
ncbi:MAG: hypothetical protein KBF28_03765 [Gemmatimonadales bacterium]|nr:hypothetical protein [Gemmatimonadales bacterium]